MAKNKLLVGLLCAALVGPMVACENATSTGNGGSNGGVQNSGNNGNNGGETDSQKLAKAAAATKAKLVEELNKDVVALKLDLEYDVEMTFNEVEETYTVVGTQDEWDMELTDSKVVEEGLKQTMGETLALVSNLDLKYYTDLLTAEDPTALTNGTNLYLSIDAKQNELSNKMEVEVKDNAFVAKMGEQTQSNQIDIETNGQIAAVLAEVRNVAAASEEELLDLAKELLAMIMQAGSASQSEPGTEEDINKMAAVEEMPNESDMMSLLLDNVLGFINGTVTSAELVEVLIPLMAGGEEVDPSMKAFLISVLDYVKTIDTAGLVKTAAATEGDVTTFTLTLDYDALKTLVGKVFDDIKALMLEVAPAESKDQIAAGMEGTKVELLAAFPEEFALSEKVGVKNGLIVSSYTDLHLAGDNLPNATGNTMSVPTDPETGDVIIGGTSVVSSTKVVAQDVSFGFSFDFGTEPFDVPTLTVA